jgi:GTPase Era involved in 16S rRNA processing
MTDNDIKIRNYDLVSAALAALPVENPHVSRLEQLIDHDFTEFCNIESGLNDVIPMRRLMKLKSEMQRIANCPQLYSKIIGAIGGGFSSGKSAFANSFLDTKKIRLAEGIKPVTAIPSYVISDPEPRIQGVTYKGGVFPIALDMYRDISHEMLKSFTFNLKDIILYTTVLAPMRDDLFKNICLTDTPGYNPPQTGTEKQDIETAQEYIKNAEFLIWMVGLDANGTIPLSDLDFLSALDFGKESGKPLFVIANKAELKPEEELEDILDEFSACLDDADLHYEGICAYSSKQKKVYGFRKKDIYQFLSEHNTNSRLYAHFANEIHEIFKDYVQMIHTDFDEKNEKRRAVKRLLLSALESGAIGVDEASNRLEEGLNDLLKYFQTEETKEKRLSRASELRDAFGQCIHDFCEAAGIEHEENVYCSHCGAVMSANEEICPHCNTLATGENKKCPSCGTILALDDIFCTECGTKTEK